jgi:hypothetical protein
MMSLGVLDLIHERRDMEDFLMRFPGRLPGDLVSLMRASYDWRTLKDCETGEIYVGEAEALYVRLVFAAAKLGLKRTFLKTGTLLGRRVLWNPEMVNLSVEELLERGLGSSKYASAAMLWSENPVLPENAPFKLKVTYDAVMIWREARKKGLCWPHRFDDTLIKQHVAFLDMLEEKEDQFVLEQEEDYCFGRAFDRTDPEDALRRGWGNLRHHESDRLEEMEEMLFAYESGEPIDSHDHRVVQAVVMKALVDDKPITVLYPDAVCKSWPGFWLALPICK